jgi:hypothetical protein
MLDPEDHDDTDYIDGVDSPRPVKEDKPIHDDEYDY